MVSRLSLLLLLTALGCATSMPGRMLVVPSMTGQLPDGRLVHPIIVVPSENILKKNEEWQAWEREWPRRYQLLTK